MMNNYNEDVTPALDTTMGLILRLNFLWRDVDVHSARGEYEQWNNKLDALFRNLSFEDDMIVIKDKAEKIISIKPGGDAAQVYAYLSSRIFTLQKILATVISRNKKDNRIPLIKSRLYSALMMKDVWLRKLMNKHNLYIKRIKKTPGTAMLGGFGQKKR